MEREDAGTGDSWKERLSTVFTVKKWKVFKEVGGHVQPKLNITNVDKYQNIHGSR